MVTETDRFTTPLYSLSEAAHYLGVPPTTFGTWAKGYVRRAPGRPEVRGAAIVTTVPGQSRGVAVIPFIGLAEGLVLAAIKESGVPLQRIRPALDRLRDEFDLEHVLASKSLYTDGAEVIYDFAEQAGDTAEARGARQLVVVRNNQRVFNEILDQYLRRGHLSPKVVMLDGTGGRAGDKTNGVPVNLAIGLTGRSGPSVADAPTPTCSA